MINPAELELLRDALATLESGASQLPPFTPEFDREAVAAVIGRVAERMRDNYPFYHPQYAGQMLKPPHAVARIAYALSLWVNPNNHALDGGRASSEMEKECIRSLGRLYGWDAPLGHLTGGGTMANLEALWVAGQLSPGKQIIGSAQAHYTHERISRVLGLTYSSVPIDGAGRMDVDAARKQMATGNVGTLVATLGTPGLGAGDPLHELVAVAGEYGVRIHVDAAYGGFFGLASLLRPETRSAFDCIGQADSVVVDPHKHGLQPYGCGCVLFRDPEIGRFYRHGSPYTYFSSAELHLGEISLECSRPGAAAVALWATQQLFPLTSGGEFSMMLDDCLLAARKLYDRLDGSTHFHPLLLPELDIVVYAAAGSSAVESSARARTIFAAAAGRDLHLALADIPTALVRARIPGLVPDADYVTCLRSVLMKPEHLGWIDRIGDLLEECAGACRRAQTRSSRVSTKPA